MSEHSSMDQAQPPPRQRGRSSMHTRRFVTTSLRQDPTAFSRLTRELAAEYIDIEGFAYEDGQLRLLTDHPDKACEVLEDLGIPAHIEELLQFDLMNGPGGLARVTEALAEEGVTVTASFSHAGGNGTGTVFLRVDDLGTAERVLDRLQPGHGLRYMRS